MASEIVYGLNIAEQIAKEISVPNVFVITDETVFSLYGDLIKDTPYYAFPAGEDSKTLDTFSLAMEKMLESGCNRKTTVIALGGGVVGDLAGFVASTYMRGVKWINIPTTLLSQVDSSVGGKTAVNLNDYKNIIGAFHLPEKVLISTHFLSTLNDREWLCGVGEIVKTSFLSSKVNALVESNIEDLLSRNAHLTYECVKACVEYKEDIVSKDLYESGLRKCLNLGHTVGHAIETIDRHRQSHGEYVLMGLEIEAFLLKDELPIGYYRIKKAVEKCKVRYPEFDLKEVANACAKDKKNLDDKVSIMLADFENTKEMKLSVKEIYGGLEQWKLNR